MSYLDYQDAWCEAARRCCRQWDAICVTVPLEVRNRVVDKHRAPGPTASYEEMTDADAEYWLRVFDEDPDIRAALLLNSLKELS